MSGISSDPAIVAEALALCDEKHLTPEEASDTMRVRGRPISARTIRRRLYKRRAVGKRSETATYVPRDFVSLSGNSRKLALELVLALTDAILLSMVPPADLDDDDEQLLLREDLLQPALRAALIAIAAKWAP